MKTTFLYSVIVGQFLLFTSAAESLAACSGSSPTWRSTADWASVKSCIARAIDRDTILVSAGTEVYDAALQLPVTKNLSILGSGIEKTVLTCSSGACFAISDGNGGSSQSRISGFTLNSGYGVELNRLDATKTFRVDHNRITSPRMTSWTVFGHSNVRPRGLIDHNELVNVRIVVGGTGFGLHDAPPFNRYQHQIWATDPGFGDGTAIYIEDNTIEVSHPGATDANYGGSYVFRFNTVTVNGVYINEFHGVQGENRTGQRWEIYGNTFINPGASIFAAAFLRGGTGLYFDNHRIGPWHGGCNLKIERSCESKPPHGQCDGASSIDGNMPGFQGWPCRDQIGRSYDLSPYGGTGPWPVQPITPAYSWNNTEQNGTTLFHFESFNGCGRERNLHSLENRDWYNQKLLFNGTEGVGRGPGAKRPSTCTPGVAYWATDEGEWNSTNGNSADGQLYQCASNGTWTVMYRPYTYPHPLQSSDAVTPIR